MASRNLFLEGHLCRDTLTDIAWQQGYIPARTYIGSYCGEVLTEAQACIRSKAEGGSAYMFQLNAETTLDGARMGNKLRFINRRCHGPPSHYSFFIAVVTTRRCGRCPKECCRMCAALCGASWLCVFNIGGRLRFVYVAKDSLLAVRGCSKRQLQRNEIRCKRACS